MCIVAKINFGAINDGIIALAKRPQSREITHHILGDMSVKIALWTRRTESGIVFALKDDDHAALAGSDSLPTLSESSQVAISFTFTQTAKPRKNNVIDALASQRREDKELKIAHKRVFWVGLKGGQFVIGDMIEITVKDDKTSYATLTNDTDFQPAQLAALIVKAVKAASATK